MMLSQSQLVVVVPCDDQAEPGLVRCALRHRWTILDLRGGASVVKSVLVSRPRVVIIEVPAAGDEMVGLAADLLGRLSRHWAPMVLLAVGRTSESGHESESLARQSGADCFLAGPCGESVIEEAVETLAPGILAASKAAIPKDERKGKRAMTVTARRIVRGA
ncbi:MAG: hypothetical protein ACT4PL_03160 [Phycisphaerales bacterium]